MSKPKIIKFKTPRYCTNASTIGYSTWKVSMGDLIKYREHYEGGTSGYRLARVLGLIRKGDGHPGNPPLSEDHLFVLAADDLLRYGYERWVALSDVVEIDSRQPGAFTRWFLFGTMPAASQALAMIKHGSMSDSYLEQYLLEPEGSICSNWREVFAGREEPKGKKEPKAADSDSERCEHGYYATGAGGCPQCA
jgi:hypothetical protein